MTMMKKLILGVVPVVLIGAVVTAKAGFLSSDTSTKTTTTTTTPTTSAGNETHLMIGVLDLATVLQSSSQAKAAGEQLKKEFKPRQDSIVAAQQQLQKDQDKYKRDGTVMSQSEAMTLQDKITREQRDLQQKQENYMQDLRTAQSAAMQKVLAQVERVVQKIAKDGKYDLILQKNSVAFNSDRVDITPQVIQQMKK
jgi:outer membrane protein